MPNGLLPSEGIAQQLECILKKSVSGIPPWLLILWVNDITPTFATAFEDLVEATWSGYSPVVLDRPTWTTPTISSNCATSTWGTDPLVWYVGGGPPETNYGYAMLDSTTNRIQFIQRFDTADIAPTAPGARVTLLPRYTLTSCSCP